MSENKPIVGAPRSGAMEEVADALREWIDQQPIVKDETGNPTIAPVYNAHVLLCELIRELEAVGAAPPAPQLESIAEELRLKAAHGAMWNIPAFQLLAWADAIEAQQADVTVAAQDHELRRLLDLNHDDDLVQAVEELKRKVAAGSAPQPEEQKSLLRQFQKAERDCQQLQAENYRLRARIKEFELAAAPAPQAQDQEPK